MKTLQRTTIDGKTFEELVPETLEDVAELERRVAAGQIGGSDWLHRGLAHPSGRAYGEKAIDCRLRIG